MLCWVVQIQLLPQIIVNRICFILQDKRKGRRLIILTATVITTINISVFCIWIPARLQISKRCVAFTAYLVMTTNTNKVDTNQRHLGSHRESPFLTFRRLFELVFHTSGYC